MRNTTRFALSLIAGSLALSAQAAETKPVAVVNGVAIPQNRLEFIVKQISEGGAKDSPEIRGKIREQMIVEELAAQEAVKQGLDKAPDMQVEMEIYKQKALARAFIMQYRKTHPISDADLKKEYDKMKEQMKQAQGDKEYHSRHILVDKEEEAKEILAQLKKGKKFDDLAKEKSKDPGSKTNGGDLGWAAPGNFVKEFSDVMVKLAKGQINPAPVKSQFGYHIIKLEDVREVQGPSFEEVKPNLQQKLQGEQIGKLIDDLKAKAKVE
ncbi:peptidylprolyl isomerase [Parachitinimonas caeni]|uniref:peptidylprolyl isomerase n=1 Tax=Parachitinimonas caeni TaxID=3031301 RepID=A0ABT7DUN3_9NEIS|nr:peptidylprolyl isomerase [Parachitinimonas caeni]MDK2123781.1 peptidylprolyl isomerase [Parachitinimonas caeni]